jgi:hypothetical protein
VVAEEDKNKMTESWKKFIDTQSTIEVEADDIERFKTMPLCTLAAFKQIGVFAMLSAI